MAAISPRPNFGDWMDARAAALGDRLALVFGERTWTYAEFTDDARRIAAGFAAAGIGRGDRVGVLLLNRPEYLQVLAGCWIRGAVAVPINTMLKTAELTHILADSGARGLVVGERFRKTAAEIRRDLPDLATTWLLDQTADGFVPFPDLLAAPPAPTLDKPAPTDPAAIVYTAGVTGRPKGAVLTHRNLLVNAGQIAAATRMTEADRALCVLPLFHVNALLVSWLAPWEAGGALVLMRGFSPREFFPAVREGATVFSAVPTVYAILAALPPDLSHDLRGLRLCISGAAPLGAATQDAFERRYGVPIVEGYGLSEATCAVTITPPDGPRMPGSVGFPLPGQEVRVVDDDGTPRPTGEVGEVVVAGESVMAGYHGDPEATAQTLDGGFLRTGDLGRLDAEGRLVLVGRKKDMIIRGGENIYPVEVEQALLRHPLVREAAVCGVPDPIWGEQVVAFVVTSEASPVTADEIIAFCRVHLADYKCPGRVEFWQELPRSAGGDVRKAEIVEEFRARTGT
jgi:long-chain acyl-CoA synthetase